MKHAKQTNRIAGDIEVERFIEAATAAVADLLLVLAEQQKLQSLLHVTCTHLSMLMRYLLFSSVLDMFAAP